MTGITTCLLPYLYNRFCTSKEEKPMMKGNLKFDDLRPFLEASISYSYLKERFSEEDVPKFFSKNGLTRTAVMGGLFFMKTTKIKERDIWKKHTNECTSGYDWPIMNVLMRGGLG